MRALLAVGLGMVAASAGAQEEFVAPQGPRELPVVPGPRVVPPTKVEGIVARIFNVEKPWLLVSPLAPASYGDGASNGTVATSERDPGKPKGFIFFGIEFW